MRADERGGYSALLGATRNEGLPIDLFDTAEPRWLEVEVDGVKQPRVLLGSVPYAMVAADAKTLGGLPPSAYLRVDGTGGGVSFASTVTDVVAPKGGVKAQVTSGTAGYLGVFTNGTDLGNSALFQSGNTISIGGTSSLGAMTLIGNAPSGDTAGMALYNSGGGGGASVSLDMYNTFANGGIPQAKIKGLDDGQYSDHITFWTKNPGAANNPVAERVRITSTGDVGIGTSSPGAKLEVAGSLKISGTGNGILFPDGTTQTTGVTTNAMRGIFSVGTGALSASSSGYSNTAVGVSALSANTSGANNVSVGDYALQKNSSGSANTATGSSALANNTSGVGNTAVGVATLESNTVGSENVAVGDAALIGNTTGNSNTALGSATLQSNSVGSSNLAVGARSLYGNTTGNYNTAVGVFSLTNCCATSHNTALGYQAGVYIGGSYNIDIGSQGDNFDDHTIRIGDVQTTTFIAGISGVNVSGVPIVVSNSGQLGVVQSSRRFKEDIQDMGAVSAGVMRLRPVTYHYKQPYADGSKPMDYGLIAEEVAEVYPDLVARSQDGQIQTVMYQKLTPMLLNEVQNLNAELASEREAAHSLREKAKSLEERISHLEAMMHQLANKSGN